MKLDAELEYFVEASARLLSGVTKGGGERTGPGDTIQGCHPLDGVTRVKKFVG